MSNIPGDHQWGKADSSDNGLDGTVETLSPLRLYVAPDLKSQGVYTRVAQFFLVFLRREYDLLREKFDENRPAL